MERFINTTFPCVNSSATKGLRRKVNTNGASPFAHVDVETEPFLCKLLKCSTFGFLRREDSRRTLCFKSSSLVVPLFLKTGHEISEMGQTQDEGRSGLAQWPRVSKFILSACAATVAEMGRLKKLVVAWFIQAVFCLFVCQ